LSGPALIVTETEEFLESLKGLELFGFVPATAFALDIAAVVFVAG
jgi:hypothetical protein